jgi:hypothetical protein
MNLPSWSEKSEFARWGQYVGFSQLPGGGAGPWGSGGWAFSDAGSLSSSTVMPCFHSPSISSLITACHRLPSIRGSRCQFPPIFFTLNVGGHIVRGLPLPRVVRDGRRRHGCCLRLLAHEGSSGGDSTFKVELGQIVDFLDANGSTAAVFIDIDRPRRLTCQ